MPHLIARAGTVAVTLTAGLALGACTSSGGGPAPSSSVRSSRPAIVSPSIAPTKAQHEIPSDRSIVEVPALRRTVTLTSCKAAPGGWAAGGSAKNVTSKQQTYHLLVFFTDRYSRTVDYARGTVTVAPGRAGTWTATKKFAPPAGTRCVLRGLY